ncbi:MAG: hypothetical protein AB1726_11440 [Planctomycetota bacterium]
MFELHSARRGDLLPVPPPTSALRGPRRDGEPAREGRVGDAGRELVRIHRREHAGLLLSAAGIGLARSLAGESLAAYPLPPLAPGLWRRRAQAVLHLAALDGLVLACSALLRRLSRESPLAWPSSEILTGAALSAGAGWKGELCHGHALLAARLVAEAGDSFRRVLDADPPPPLCWRAWEGLAAAHAAAGRTQLALGAMEAAADQPGCGVGPLASGLYLALRAGDRRRAARAAARLDLLVQADEPAFVAALGRVRRHAAGAGRPASLIALSSPAPEGGRALSAAEALLQILA